MPRPMKPAIPKATITGPDGWFFGWHASYTVGIGIVEQGSLAFTRRGIERKVRRMLRKLERDQQRHAGARTITGGHPARENDDDPRSPRHLARGLYECGESG